LVFRGVARKALATAGGTVVPLAIRPLYVAIQGEERM
jgi:hypothetical protein